MKINFEELLMGGMTAVSTDNKKSPPIEKCTFAQGTRSTAYFEKFVRCCGKKRWGILIEKESKSLDFTGLKVPRDHNMQRRLVKTYFKES